MNLKSAVWGKDFPAPGLLLSSENILVLLANSLNVMAPSPMLTLLPAFHNLQWEVAKTCFTLAKCPLTTTRADVVLKEVSHVEQQYKVVQKGGKKVWVKRMLILHVFFKIQLFSCGLTSLMKGQQYSCVKLHKCCSTHAKACKSFGTNFCMAHYLCPPDHLPILSKVCVKSAMASGFVFSPWCYTLMLLVSTESHTKHKCNTALCRQLFKQSLNTKM